MKQVNGLKHAAIGGGFQAFASCFFLIRDPSDPAIPIMLTNMGYFMSFAFYYQATRVLSDRKAAWFTPLGIIAVLLPLIYVFRTNDYINERMLVSLSGIGILLMMISYVMFKTPVKLPGRRVLILTYLSCVLVCFFSVVYILITREQVHEASNFKILQVAFIWLLVTSFITTLSFIILTSEKLQQQLKVQVDLLAKARDIANASLQQQRHFLSMLSHEFKVPIGAIQANVDTVLHIQKEQAPAVEKSLYRVKNVSNRLSTLVDHCLNNEWLAHSIEHHQETLEPLSLTRVVDSICDEFSVRFKGIEKDAVIKGEPIFLPVLFSNLVANACKYASDISAVEVELTEDDNKHYIVRVLDDGPGIPDSEQSHIFERYYRADINDLENGSGLGLYFVKRIAEVHSGTVTVSCDQSTVFTVTLNKI